MLRLVWLWLVAATGCVIPIAAPSTRVEGGYVMGGQTGHGTLRAGAHVVGNRLTDDASWDLGAGYVTTAGTEMTQGSQGFYVEGSYLHRIDRSARLSIGPGVNAAFRGVDHVFAPVAYLRGAVELFSSVSGGGASHETCGSTMGGWHGQLGIGTYVDVQHPLTDGGIAVVAGLTLRLPAFAGLALVIPHCK